jgi:16S rRNA (cytosine967-C5)-methyltransferase
LNTREVALEILFEVHRRVGVFAQERVSVESRRRKLPKRDRRFLTELVFGVLRHEATLDRVVAAHSDLPFDEIGPRAKEALRLGVYQLLYLDGIPAFAAVGETVAAVRDARARPFVNGVLRAIDRQVRRVPLDKDRGGASPRKRLQIGERKVCFFSRDVFADPDVDEALHLAQVYSHPVELVRRWLARFGSERTRAILEHDQQPPPLFVRVNRLKTTREQLLERLRAEELKCGEGNLPDSVRVLAPPTELVHTQAFEEGLCSVQDETAMGVAPKLVKDVPLPRPDALILDLCAAPGGKTTHLAELTGDAATILAVDRDEERLERVRESIARLGLKSVSCMVADATDQASIKEVTPAPYDRVLVDAPCSNSGVLARRPEARTRLAGERLEKHLAELVELQRKLLTTAVGRLYFGGLLAYSTCSLEPEENHDQVAWLLAKHRDLELLSETETLPVKSDAAGVSGDGGFVAVIRKKADGLPPVRRVPS